MNSIQMRGIAAAVSGALLLGAAPVVLADSTDDIINALIAKGVLTEEEGSLLIKGRTGEKEAAEERKKKEVTATYKDGIVIGSADGKNSITVNGRVHADYRSFSYDESNDIAAAAGSSGGADTWDVRRARLGVKAKFLDYYEGEIVLNGTGSAPVLDVAYLNVAWWKAVQFRVGQFKMPFSLEQLTSSNNIDFVERSFVDAYIPAKEIGAMVHGSPWKGVTYGLAFSNGRGQNGTESDIRVDNQDVIGRATVNFAELMGNENMVLHAGVAFSEGDISKADGAASFGGNRATEARGVSFFTAPVVSGNNISGAEIDRSRLGLEAAVAYGPFKVQGQWVRNKFDFDTATSSYDPEIKAWYAEALWTITGESHAGRYKSGAFSGLKPASNFDPAKFKGGAWEVGVRYSRFDASDFNNTAGLTSGIGADAQISTKANGFTKADALTMGVKFVPNAHVRFMLDYVQTDFEDAVGNLAGVSVNGKNEDDEKALLFRTQFAF
jgi:phosphate-selective porin OprO/OprP